MKNGSLLEKDAKRLFSLLGFKTKNNVKIKGYEIDVYATSENSKIVVECKQREKSESLDLRNLIHQWSSKNSILKVDKVILIIYGLRVNSSYKTLGKKLGVIVWDEKDFERFMNLAIENNKKARELFAKNTKVIVSDKKILLSPKIDKEQKKLKERLKQIDLEIKECENNIKKAILENNPFMKDFNLMFERRWIKKLQQEKKDIEEMLEV